MRGKYIQTFVYFLCLLTYALQSTAQLDQTISVSFDQKPLVDVIGDLETQADLKFFFKDEWLEDKVVSGNYTEIKLSEVLTQMLTDNNLTFYLRQPNYIILLPNTGSKSRRVDNTLTDRVSIGSIDLGNRKGILSGNVVDGQTDLPLESVIVTIDRYPARYITLADGYFEFTLTAGNYQLQFHHPSMVDFSLPIVFNSDGSLTVDMFEDVTMLEEVVVNTQAVDQNIAKTITGKDVIDVATIKVIPAFFGEADVFNSVLSLPGVSKVGEGSSGINVRGGGVGQNLILLDNSVIYNPAHLFGFFSTFNTDAVSRVNFFKGTVPVEYGGRLSAIMDVEMKSGSKQALKGNGGVGLINSRITLEGPIEKDTTSFLMSVRAAYPSYMLRNLEDPSISTSTTYFGDANVKLDHLFNDKNRISATGYWSRDLFDFSNELKYNYGNIAGGLEWNTQFKRNTYLTSAVNYTIYDYSFEDVANPTTSSRLTSSVEQLSFNNKFQTSLGAHELTYGTNLSLISLQPGDYVGASESSTVEPLTISDEDGIEGSVFVGDSYALNDRLTIYGGMRYSFFSGGKSGLEKVYHGPEPRISANYRITPESSIKFGYSRMRQYVHFISNTASATPIDLWKLSNTSLRPQVGDQVSLGYFRNFKDNQFETSIEGYYKRTVDLVEYRNNASLFLNENLEDELLQGNGRAYGVEVQIKKNSGSFNGWVSYTFSRSLIQTTGTIPSQLINEGQYFPTNFDQPHNLSAFGKIQISRRFSINANFTFNTGRPITLPESVYQIRGVTVADFGERNNYRIPDYHRLDISFVLGTTLKREKKIEANWSLSIYNLYGRDNAYSVYFRNDNLSTVPTAYQLSVIAQPIVALSYNFKF